jgi:DNA-binding response OmpR family regulator
MKIVALDDSKAILMALEKYLAGFELLTFADVDGFMENVRVNSYDLFIIDINLPKKNGLDVINEIKDYPHLSNAIFVILTAESSAKYKEIAKQLNIKAYIKKPFSSNIKGIVEKIIKRFQNENIDS